MKALIFIDTNIFLDFYRARGDSGLSLLTHIDKFHDRIITSKQVAMEFKKNRQRVILESLNLIKIPNWGGLTGPAFLAGSDPAKLIQKSKNKISEQSKKLRLRISKVLEVPYRYDPVYKVLQRLFKNKGSYNLNRTKKFNKQMIEQAEKRFLLGYPPRKINDTSIGDAINWEWIIHCANESKMDIIIVSRDTDFGIVYDKKPILNDWLSHEFKDRVSKKRKLYLTDKLAKGFKLASISVTHEEEAEEEKLIQEIENEKSTGKQMVNLSGDLQKRFSKMDLGENLQDAITKFLTEYKLKEWSD